MCLHKDLHTVNLTKGTLSYEQRQPRSSAKLSARLYEWRGVNCNVHYKPLPMMTAYKELGWDIKDFPNAFDYYSNLITLPLHTKLTDEDVKYVCECFREVVGEYL